ncbi:hypothetical protein CTAYLR_003296 [Chrysophaeum taylorii]|uniref:Uncharacterized protein n=1 Tax=Chrysophaeum taylorii TaxID=2483200 RepID=A0AAD7UIL8_9STRA|nr:hypothetical protein CTAYLR_003296 [Chrysophaeum taylorii]
MAAAAAAAVSGTTTITTRERVIEEIKETERSFVASVRTAISVFVTQWTDAGKSLEAAAATDPALTAVLKELSLLFNFNSKLLEELESEPNVGKVFSDFAPYLKMFARYLSLYERWSQEKGSTATKETSEFGSFVKACEQDPRCEGQTLGSFLIMPVQRVPRYRLLLEELLKHSEGQPDVEDVRLAVDLVRDSAGRNNAANESTHFDALTKLQLSMFDPANDLNLLDWPARRLELGPVEMKKLCRKGPKNFTFWLVSDKILYAQKVMGSSSFSYQLNRQILLAECVVGDTAFATLSQRSTRRAQSLMGADAVPRARSQCFQILSAKKSFVVEAPSIQTANDWRDAIDRLQQRSNDRPVVAPIWVPDKAVKACDKCREPFTVLRRRHHCRSCGKCFCKDCSKYSKILPHLDASKKLRVCLACYETTVDDKPNNNNNNNKGFAMPRESVSWRVPESNPFQVEVAKNEDDDDTDDEEEDEEEEEEEEEAAPTRDPPPVPADVAPPAADKPPKKPFNPFAKPPARERAAPPPPPRESLKPPLPPRESMSWEPSHPPPPQERVAPRWPHQDPSIQKERRRQPEEDVPTRREWPPKQTTTRNPPPKPPPPGDLATRVVRQAPRWPPPAEDAAPTTLQQQHANKHSPKWPPPAEIAPSPRNPPPQQQQLLANKRSPNWPSPAAEDAPPRPRPRPRPRQQHAIKHSPKWPPPPSPAAENPPSPPPPPPRNPPPQQQHAIKHSPKWPPPPPSPEAENPPSPPPPRNPPPQQQHAIKHSPKHGIKHSPKWPPPPPPAAENAPSPPPPRNPPRQQQQHAMKHSPKWPKPQQSALPKWPPSSVTPAKQSPETRRADPPNHQWPPPPQQATNGRSEWPPQTARPTANPKWSPVPAGARIQALTTSPNNIEPPKGAPPAKLLALRRGPDVKMPAAAKTAQQDTPAQAAVRRSAQARRAFDADAPDDDDDPFA